MRLAGGEIPPEVLRLLDFDTLKFFLGLGLFDGRGWSGAPLICVQIPGEPGIVLTTDGFNPFGQPWHVSLGTEAWYSTDPEFARTIAAYVPPSQLMTPIVFRDERLLTEGVSWWDLRQEVARICTRKRYEAIAGYEGVTEKFRVELDTAGEFAGTTSWPIVLLAKDPADIEVIRVENLDYCNLDWNSVLTSYSQAAKIVESLDWLRDWKHRKNGSLALVMQGGPTQIEGWKQQLTRACQESGLDGETQFYLQCRIGWRDIGIPISFPLSDFKDSYACCAGLICAASGTILFDGTAGSPIEEFCFKTDIRATGQFVLARPGESPQLKTISTATRGR